LAHAVARALPRALGRPPGATPLVTEAVVDSYQNLKEEHNKEFKKGSEINNGFHAAGAQSSR